jgi:hypothetical protein
LHQYSWNIFGAIDVEESAAIGESYYEFGTALLKEGKFEVRSRANSSDDLITHRQFFKWTLNLK